MNPKPKNEQRIADVREGSPAAAFRHSGGKTPLKAAGELSVLEKFRKMNFIGGTIVDYSHGSRFGIECRRKTIGTFSIEGDSLALQSDSGLLWAHEDINRLRIVERNGVFRITGPRFPDCAVAPRGVEIPKKETIAEAIDDSVRLLSEGKRGARREDSAKPAEADVPTLDELLDAFLVLRGLRK